MPPPQVSNLMLDRQGLRERDQGVATHTSSNSELRADERTSVTPVDAQYDTRKRPQPGYSPNSQLDDDVLRLDLVELQSYITRLEHRAKTLGASITSNPQPAFTYQTLYRILHYESDNNSDSDSGSKAAQQDVPFFNTPEWISCQI
ncbi:hypothetical protein E0Z10_g4753 [Xylaria hypoxylon]|uniref:Uncharacterized protein n=1 Tax=Xylaria hypoxylon TaxID=37992 RepID=A0A4Z0YJE4_9PEZI|nr:hypothetical protein E0Z10_g4753 [Xylaria hypoxylon]